jgi:propanediol utilization protein
MKTIKVPVEVSARHIHISQKDAKKLFGVQYVLHKKNDISQTGQFATKETVDLKGTKKTFFHVRIVGPEREKSQIELSVTDCMSLGIPPEFHVSGDTKKAPLLEIIGPVGKVKVPAIVPLRHIHISDQEAKKLKLKNKQIVTVQLLGKRALILQEVIVRVHPSFRFRLHLDTDEGNAAGVKSGDIGTIVLK